MWSTYRFVPSKEPTKDVRLFAASLGQYGQGFGHGQPLRHANTNCREAGRTNGVSLNVTGVAWDLWGCERDIRNLYDTSSWCWDFITTRLDGSPLSGLRPISSGEGMASEDGHLLDILPRLKAEDSWNSPRAYAQELP